MSWAAAAAASVNSRPNPRKAEKERLAAAKKAAEAALAEERAARKSWNEAADLLGQGNDRVTFRVTAVSRYWWSDRGVGRGERWVQT